MEEQGQDVVTQAKELISHGEHQEAIELLEAWLQENPEDVSGWAALGAAHFELENWTEAEKGAREVVRLRPDSAREWSNLGTVLRKSGEVEEAARVQRRALALDHSYDRAHSELSKLRRLHATTKPRTTPAETPSSAVSKPGSVTRRKTAPRPRNLALMAGGLVAIIAGGLFVVAWAILGERSGPQEEGQEMRPSAKTPSASEEPTTQTPAVRQPVAAPAPTTPRAPPLSTTRPRPPVAQPQPTAAENPSQHWTAQSPMSPSPGTSSLREAPTPPPPSGLRAEALHAIRDVETAVEVGVNYQKYPDYVITAAQKLRRLANEAPKRSLWWQEVMAALDDYEFAQDAWGWKFDSDGVRDFVAEGTPEWSLAGLKYRGKIPKMYFHWHSGTLRRSTPFVSSEPPKSGQLPPGTEILLTSSRGRSRTIDGKRWVEVFPPVRSDLPFSVWIPFGSIDPRWELSIDGVRQTAWSSASQHIRNAEWSRR